LGPGLSDVASAFRSTGLFFPETGLDTWVKTVEKKVEISSKMQASTIDWVTFCSFRFHFNILNESTAPSTTIREDSAVIRCLSCSIPSTVHVEED
jgi:hypothetical protein